MSYFNLHNVEGRVEAIRVGTNPGTVSPQLKLSNQDIDSISYEIRVATSNVKYLFSAMQPVNRTGRNCKINTAAVGTPCILELQPNSVRLFLAEEEIPHGPCPLPAPTAPGFSGSPAGV